MQVCTNVFFLFFKGGYGGRIINIASVAGIMLMEPLTIEHSSYTVAKHGVVALTRSFVPAAFPKRSVHVQISKFYPDFIKQLIKGFGFISLLHTHKEAHYKVPWAFFITPIFDNVQLSLRDVVPTLYWGIEPGLHLGISNFRCLYPKGISDEIRIKSK